MYCLYVKSDLGSAAMNYPIQWYLYCTTPAMSDFLPFTTDFSGTDGFKKHFDLR